MDQCLLFLISCPWMQSLSSPRPQAHIKHHHQLTSGMGKPTGCKKEFCGGGSIEVESCFLSLLLSAMSTSEWCSLVYLAPPGNRLPSWVLSSGCPSFLANMLLIVWHLYHFSFLICAFFGFVFSSFLSQEVFLVQ